MVTGEKGQRLIVHDEGKFDPSEIPLQTWTDYENELWERNSARSIGSIIEAARQDNKSRQGSHAGSMYAPSLYGPPMTMHPSPSFGHSPAASQYGGTPAAPAASSYFHPAQVESPRQSLYNMPQAGMQQSYPTGMSGYGTPGAMSMYGAPPGVMYPQQGFGSTPSVYGMGMPNQHTSQYGFGGAQSVYGGSQMGMAQQPQSGRQTPSLGAENMFGNAGLSDVGATPRGTLPSDEVIGRDIRQRE